MRRILLIGLIYFAIVPNHWAQQFYRSSGLQIFNQGLYQAAIDTIQQWSQTHEAERGIATYYIGECNYNLGLESPSKDQAVQYFQRGAAMFKQAVDYPDLGTLFSEKYNDALFKQAWCQLRLAEIQRDPLPSLNEAYRLFFNLAGEANDSLSMHAAYLAAESRLRASQWLRYQVWQTENQGTQSLLTERGLRFLNQARQSLNKITNQTLLPASLQLVLKVRLVDVAFEKGKWFQSMPDWLYQQIRDQSMPETVAEAAVAAFNSENYKAILNSVTLPTKKQIAADIYYSEAVRTLNLYLISNELQDLHLCNTCLDSLHVAAYRAEKSLLMGARDYAGGIERDAFLRLSNPNQSFFAQAADRYSEGWYWMGWTQRVVDPKGTVDGFDKFLNQSAQISPEPRIQILREDAQLQRLLMQFDQAASNPAVLRQIRTALDQFKPQSETIARECNLLRQLVQVGLGESIWSQVLQSASVEDKLTESFMLIRSMLARATRVTGKERVPYLDYLDRLFQITKERRNEETRFYRGMALFLRAEIQETEASKRRYYFAAADTLQDISGIYQYEGEYIRARSYFAAAKHEQESNQKEVYDRARPIFIRLINEKGSLRSVYYLAEILHHEENDRAAITCYDVVMEKTKNREAGGFWYSNALAGKQRCRDVGNASALSEIQLDQVQFPDNLLIIDGEPVSLERFADPEYAQRQIWEDGIKTFMQFGLSKRNIYPSLDAPADSRYMAHSLHSFRLNVRERLAAVQSGLRLQIIVPGQIPLDTRVFLNDELMEQNSDGYYEKRPIALGSEFNLRIENGFCYPEVRRLSFDHPGIQRIAIPLIRKMTFHSSSDQLDPRWQIVHINQRPDDARYFLRSSRSISKSSQLYRDFTADLKLRDFCYSSIHDGYLVTHSAENQVRVYNRLADRIRGQNIPMVVPERIPPLESPEGIAVDPQGNIYISDYATHRVFVFRQDGQFVTVFGALGKNRDVRPGEAVQFTFPTQLTVVVPETEGTEGSTAPILFVMDRYGVHMINPIGLYYETLELDPAEWGSLQDIAVDGFGHIAEIHLICRPDGRIKRFQSRPVPAQ
ncbi:hypothetical protein HQ585_08870 [candidate division KSB1 bacterium]|nr:hypothetical protein [candidate division KSB1 bacterium]